MAIVLNTTPGNYQSAHGDILFVAYEATKAIDPTTYPNYKYVCDVYISSTLVSRLKTFPDPLYYRGKFNIGEVVRNYLSHQLNGATGIRAQELGDGEFSIDVICKFGEEYNGTLYTNLTVDSTRTYYNHYNGRLVGDNTILDSYLDLALTNRPAITAIDLNTLNHYIPYFPSNTSAFNVVIKTYDSSNTLITTQTDSFSAGTAKNLQLFNAGPGAINSAHSNLINSGVKYYTFKIGATSIYQFNVNSECKYTTYSLHFLNKFGGYESYDFTKVSKKSITIEKKDFGQLGYRMDSSGNIGYNTSNGVLYEERNTYASQYDERIKLNSDWIDDNTYVWLTDLMLSPVVYLQQGTYLIPVQMINQTEYEQKKNNSDHLTNIELTVQYGARLNAQYR
jgi:hypothetical protein